MKEDNISQLGDYDAPFCEQQYTHGSCYMSLFKFKSFDQLIPPKLPQILDIYSVVALLITSHFLAGRKNLDQQDNGRQKRDNRLLSQNISLLLENDSMTSTL